MSALDTLAELTASVPPLTGGVAVLALLGALWWSRRRHAAQADRLVPPLRTAPVVPAPEPEQPDPLSELIPALPERAPHAGQSEPTPFMDEPLPAGEAEVALPSVAIGVSEADLLTEAEVFLQFGYTDRAADTLRRYVDQTSGATHELTRLLGLYLELERIDDYGEILERLADLDIMTPSSLEEAVLAGLQRAPSTLALRVFAEERLGWDVDTVACRLGHPLTVEPTPSVPSAPVDTGPLAAAPRPLEGSLVLVEGDMPLAPPSAEERRALLGLAQRPRTARLLAAAGATREAVHAYRQALPAAQRPLSLLIDLLHLHYRHRDLPAYAKDAWHSFTLLGQYGHPLRERLLRMGFALGTHPVLEGLAEADSPAALEHLGRVHGYVAVPAPAPMGTPLVAVEGPAPSAVEAGQDPLEEAESYLAFGQTDLALAELEQAVAANPEDARCYPLLLDLYERLEASEQLHRLVDELRRRHLRPPREAAQRISQLRQRWRMDDDSTLMMEEEGNDAG
ncbi:MULTISPECIES: hypothetical protein [Gulbenkiania]|uniref:Uncharacterized protein n=2 Tax=Gulbenkiania TaxID=397456 RepID=A0A0K6GXC1_9NEIS|nr:MULTISPECIES: hypothetical protein [Gulbenkiania]TCW32925.1 hypothetical protein EV669_102224 [Gulbenkiania mobilis]CUA83392.1 hypothetical protein Ga0061063_1720 [Gulbenkiania indica]